MDGIVDNRPLPDNGQDRLGSSKRTPGGWVGIRSHQRTPGSQFFPGDPRDNPDDYPEEDEKPEEEEEPDPEDNPNLILEK